MTSYEYLSSTALCPTIHYCKFDHGNEVNSYNTAYREAVPIWIINLVWLRELNGFNLIEPPLDGSDKSMHACPH